MRQTGPSSSDVLVKILTKMGSNPPHEISADIVIVFAVLLLLSVSRRGLVVVGDAKGGVFVVVTAPEMIAVAFLSITMIRVKHGVQRSTPLSLVPFAMRSKQPDTIYPHDARNNNYCICATGGGGKPRHNRSLGDQAHGAHEMYGSEIDVRRTLSRAPRARHELEWQTTKN
mgnify:CR=1 FL=1